MIRILVSTVAGFTALLAIGTADAQTARTRRDAERDVTVTGTLPAFVAQRCSGAACLRGIPSIGVGF